MESGTRVYRIECCPLAGCSTSTMGGWKDNKGNTNRMALFICSCSPYVALLFSRYVSRFRGMRMRGGIFPSSPHSPPCRSQRRRRRKQHAELSVRVSQGLILEGLSHLIFDTSNLSFPGGDDDLHWETDYKLPGSAPGDTCKARRPLPSLESPTKREI